VKVDVTVAELFAGIVNVHSKASFTLWLKIGSPVLFRSFTAPSSLVGALPWRY
jgi:hypothetical protein